MSCDAPQLPEGWRKAWEKGEQARQRGIPLEDNPFDDGDPLRKYWVFGWTNFDVTDK